MSCLETLLFPLGSLVITTTANECLEQSDIDLAIQRHIAGDWGDLDPNDLEANESALKFGGRLLSSYKSKSDVAFWIITEADRSYTTILLPEDY